jgi:hypothetical protein
VRRAAWLEHSTDNREVKGSNPFRPMKLAENRLYWMRIASQEAIIPPSEQSKDERLPLYEIVTVPDIQPIVDIAPWAPFGPNPQGVKQIHVKDPALVK